MSFKITKKTGEDLVKIEAPKAPEPASKVVIAGERTFQEKFDSAFGAPPDMFNLPTRPEDGITSLAMEYEDEFRGLYGLGFLRAGITILEPPFNKLFLEELVERNNALKPCIDAMLTNIDGTGWEIEPEDVEDDEDKGKGKAQAANQPAKAATKKPNVTTKASTSGGNTAVDTIEPGDTDDEDGIDPMIKNLMQFFKEPWPGISWTTVRKKLRWDMERTGEAFLEVIRDAKDQIVYARPIDSKTMRLIELDGGYYVPKEVDRMGVTRTLQVHVRRRRFIQKLVRNYIYFKEFGAERDLNKDTGEWAVDGERLQYTSRSTEVIHFTVDKDTRTPYGIPRWTAQIPSVIGSRKAEELNLNFFDAGGVPPAMVLVSGGNLAPKMQQNLERFMSADPKIKNRVAVVEVVGDGALGQKDTVKVQVERFGSDRQTDSMFEQYDEKCEERVRKAFRLPPMFVGKAQDYNFATALASYTVAEAQVFAPERQEFDEIITMQLIRAMGGEGYVFRSNPLTVNDTASQFAAIQAAQAAGSIDNKEFIDQLNKTLHLKMQMKEGADDVPPTIGPDGKVLTDADGQPIHPKAKMIGYPQLPVDKEGKPIPTGGSDSSSFKKQDVQKSSESLIKALAEDMLVLIKNGDYGVAYGKLMQDVGALNPEELKEFRKYIARKAVGEDLINAKTTSEIFAESLSLMAARRVPE